jgi:hypothetical protein
LTGAGGHSARVVADTEIGERGADRLYAQSADLKLCSIVVPLDAVLFADGSVPEVEDLGTDGCGSKPQRLVVDWIMVPSP